MRLDPGEGILQQIYSLFLFLIDLNWLECLREWAGEGEEKSLAYCALWITED